MPRPLAHCLALLPLLLAPSAQAASIQILTQLTSNPAFILGPQAGIFTPGEDVLIEITFDEMAVDGNPSMGIGTFLSAVSQLDVSFQTSGLSFQFGNPLSSIGTADDMPSGTDSVAFSSSSRIGGSTPGGVPASISVLLVQMGGAGDLVVNDRPATGPVAFTSATFDLNTTGIGATNMLLEGGTVVVPEPGSAGLLLLAGVAGAAIRFRRR